MKRNGFTLVEMLAVIVLIALLSGIAVGTYARVNESAKRKTLETKIAEIKTAAEKWARENNITSKTTLSVNALVVEGYITADENKVDQIAVIKNPVTGKNMVCNVVDITFEKGEIVTKFNDTVENCKLATQSLVDTNISIKVIDSSNIDRSGSSTASMAAWTNKDVMLVVSSTNYDSRATSISFDFEGNTTTYEKSGRSAYAGNAYLTKAQAASYYNVFHIDASLLLNSKVVVTYNIPNETNKSRAYAIRIDKEEATATIKANSEWIADDKPVTVMVDDGKGSGPRYFYVTKTTSFNSNMKYDANYKGTSADLEVGTYYIWTEDNAGNRSSTYKAILEINNVDKTNPACEVVFHGNAGDHGWYKEVAVTPAGKNSVPAGISGMNIGVNTTQNSPVYTGFAYYNTYNEGPGTARTTNTTRDGVDYYCHVKTIAGKYANAKRTLYLDMTPPTVTVNATSDDTYTKSKTVRLTVTDALSGMPDSIQLRYGWSKQASGAHPVWFPLSNSYSYYTRTATFSLKGGIEGSTMTGIYYLYIDYSGIKDYAGNKATGVGGSGSGGVAIFGPFMFDNTPPVCDGVAGKTDPTNGEYSLSQDCRDDFEETNQSGCVLDTYPKDYDSNQTIKTDTITIADNAGNTTDCTVNVYLDNINPSCSFTAPAVDGNNGWYKSSSVTLTASFQDNGNYKSGVKDKGAAKTSGSTNGSSTVTFTENGSSLTAYCYVTDNAGNSGSNSYTIKKDDGSEMGNCKIIYGNTSWKNAANITVGVELGSKPISGCNDGYNCVAKDEYPIHNNEAVTQANTSGNSSVMFMSNSGVTYYCTNGPHNIYSDRKKPSCTATKSNTGTTSGVTFNVTCDDGSPGSGCVTSGDHQGEHTDVKSSKTYTVKDNVGNEGTCSASVTSYSCNPHNCNKHTCYGKWSDLGACNVPDNKAKNSDTKECTECGSQGLYQCKTRSSWDCYDTCYETCYS